MLVRELIATLKQFDGDLDVIFEADAFEDYNVQSVALTDEIDGHPLPHPYVSLRARIA